MPDALPTPLTGPLGWVLLAAAALVVLLRLLPLVVAPLFVATRLRFRVPRLEPLGESPPLPIEARATQARLVQALQAHGYSAGPALVDATLLTGTRLELHLWQDPAGPDGATLLIARAGPPGGERAEVDLHLGTRFADGTVLVTTNSLSVARLPARPAVRQVQLPGQDDVDLLLAVHRLRRAREGAGQATVSLAAHELANVMERDLAEDLAHAERAGVLLRQGDAWRPTWGAALRLGWAACWPFSGLLRWRLRRRHGALVAEARSAARPATPPAA